MIEKLITITNVGKYRGFKSEGDVAFRKVNAIFGENGGGKSTMSAIFKSLSENNPSRISERKTVGSTTPIAVQLRIANATYTFGANGWSASVPNLKVFDLAFVHEHAHEGDAVTVDQRRNLYKVVLGSTGVDLAKAVDELTARISQANSKVNDDELKVSHSCGGAKADWIIKQQIPITLDQQITQQEAVVKAAENAPAVTALSKFGSVDEPVIPETLTQVFSSTLETITPDVLQRIEDHLVTLGQNSETWIATGSKLVSRTAGSCPFCLQDLSASQIASFYGQYFSQEYTKLQSNVEELCTAINSSFGTTATEKLKTRISTLRTGLATWKPYLQLALPLDESAAAIRQIEEIYSVLAVASSKKKQSPLGLPLDEKTLVELVTNLNAAVETLGRLNEAIDKTNTDIDEFKQNLANANLDALKTKLNALRALKKSTEPASQAAITSYKQSVKIKEALESAKRDARKKLDEYDENTPRYIEKEINAILQRFGCTFKICASKRENSGGKPSFSYAIEIDKAPVPLAPGNQAPSPSFRTALSAGDRSSLALAFFLAQLKRDPNVGDCIVVFDDPFCSQDSGRRSQTISEILSVAEIAKQVVVFSHEPTFLREFVERAPTPGSTKCLYIRRSAEGVVLAEHDLHKATESVYTKDCRDLQVFVAEGSGNHLDVLRKLRPCLETWLRQQCPNVFPEGTGWLGDYLNKMRDAQPTDPAFKIKDHYSEFAAINDYSKKYHHGAPSTSELILPTDTELVGMAIRTLNILNP